MTYWRSTLALYSLCSSHALDTFHSLKRPKLSHRLLIFSIEQNF